MKLITRFELACLSEVELHGLLCQEITALANAPRGSQDRRDAVASIRNIEDELVMRTPGL